MRTKNIQNKIAKLKKHYRVNTFSVLSGGVFAGTIMAIDINEADAIFYTARTANSTFSHMSDTQIIDYCNGLDPEQMIRIINLVHGRYFEELVANASGGILFEAKNHPNTDMILNGTEYSIKSNDTTADSIVDFETYSPQDLGMNDEELRDRSFEVLDGDIIDAAEVLLSGALGFGAMATLQAVGESSDEWENLPQWEKTKTKAAVIGTKTVGKAAAGTAKST